MSFTPDYVCSNPNCKSYGRRHPNCRCESPGQQYAEGGEVHFCSKQSPHNPECEHFAEGGEVQDNLEFQNNPDLAIDHAVLNNGLLHTLSKSGFTRSEEPGRAGSDLLDTSRRGRSTLKSHSASILEPKTPRMNGDLQRANALQEKLDMLNANPETALNIGGDLGDTLPAHHAAIAAKAATAMNYLQSIKPQPTQAGPLDAVIPPGESKQKHYRRQLEIAENPSLIYQHAKDGSLLPQDLQTLSALYPKLRNKIQDHAFETLAQAKAANKNLTRAQKRQFGALIGQRLTFQQTPEACQAIMKANAPAQMPVPPQKKPKKASGVELKQIDKANELALTPLQKLQTSRNI